MIQINRFLVPSSAEDEWKAVRRTGITATAVAKAATPAGFKQFLEELESPVEVADTPFMKFGRDNESWIVRSLKNEYGVLPNDWLIAHEKHDWMMATPDGLSLDHSRIVEVKTTGKDWGEWSKVPIGYRRQVQWQLEVTGATDCVFAWVVRKELADGSLVPAWFEPKVVVVERDEKMIEELLDVADRLRMDAVYRSWNRK